MGTGERGGFPCDACAIGQLTAAISHLSCVSMAVQRPNPAILNEEECRGFQTAIELVGRRWTGAILLALSRGAGRFGEILAMVDGLSDRLLSQRLKELEAEHLVERTVVPTTPVQVRYALSDHGRELMAAMQPLVNWGIKAKR
jgi:DNA-binding HxlR family transcriptional regulator